MRLAWFLLLAGCADGVPTPHARGPDLHPAHEVGRTVALVVNDKQVDVSVEDVPHAGARVRLRDLWSAGLPTDDPMLLHFDLYDVDGFHLATRAACNSLLNGSDFSAASMDATTHDIDFDDAHSINDCYRMRAVVRIVGMR